MAVDPNTIWQQTQISDPAYLAAHSNNRAALIAALTGYGDPSSAFAVDPTTGQSLAGQYNIAQSDVSGAATSPYSTLAQLKNQLIGNQTGVQRTANAHGDLYSGANLAATGAENLAGQQRNYTAQQGLRSAIAGITGNDTTALTGAFNNDYAQALADQTVPVTPAAVAPNVATPSAPVVDSTAPGALNNPIAPGGGVPFHTSAGGVAAPKPPKIPKPKVPANVLRNE